MKKNEYLNTNEVITVLENECTSMSTEEGFYTDTMLEFFWDFGITPAVFRHVNRHYAY